MVRVADTVRYLHYGRGGGDERRKEGKGERESKGKREGEEVAKMNKYRSRER